ncbi:hypothetical protein [Bacillus amyloliquefaciens]|uniref:hypothetical protein n=1 Tax=Bacillus amyloliquefaciens TaxID=1390 RepID=UPI00149569DD|nr:hypothetical protein [Bacillus amyloliquefaciens]
MTEAARLIEKAIGKLDLVYIQTTEETARNEEKAGVKRKYKAYSNAGTGKYYRYVF